MRLCFTVTILVIGLALVACDERERILDKVTDACVDADFAWRDFQTCSKNLGPQRKRCVFLRATAVEKDGNCAAARAEMEAYVIRNRKN